MIIFACLTIHKNLKYILTITWYKHILISEPKSSIVKSGLTCLILPETETLFTWIFFSKCFSSFEEVSVWTLRYMNDAEIPCYCLITACVTHSPVLSDTYNYQVDKRRTYVCVGDLCMFISFPLLCTNVRADKHMGVCVCVCERLALLCFCVCVCLSMSVHAVPPVAPCCVCVSLSSGGCSNGSCD